LNFTFSITEIILILVILLLIVIMLSQSKLEFKYETKSTAEDSKKEDQLDRLSPTEYKILELLAGGKSNKQIAEEMFISVATVKKHITHIFKKTGISKRAEARRFKEHFQSETR